MWRPTLEVLSRCQRGLLACGPDTRTAGSNDFAEQGSFAVFLTSALTSQASNTESCTW